ncbi:MAG: hypothetical protein DMG14_16215 [Acidobacteria bacterium]|nr:MAG: hypothetical protein DMG14_16215 [Acidobacteriota bacterium]
MPTREELHKLIDTMPEGAIEAAHRMLSNLQVWPPAPPPGVEEMRKDMRKRMEERRLEVMQRQKPGTVGGSAALATMTRQKEQELPASNTGKRIPTSRKRTAVI